MRTLITAAFLLVAGTHFANAGALCNLAVSRDWCEQSYSKWDLVEDMRRTDRNESDYEDDSIALESPERVHAWERDCKPTLVTGKDGLRRYTYAHAGCDVRPIK